VLSPITTFPALDRTDLIHSRGALLRRLEEFCATCGADPTKAVCTSVGYFLDLRRVRRVKGSYSTQATPQYCHLFDVLRIDEFGTQLLVSRTIGDAPAGAFVGFCSYLDTSAAAEYFRHTYLGQAMWQAYGSASLAIHSSDATGALNLLQKEPNAPFSGSCYCETRYGDLLRIGAQDVYRTLKFFLVAQLPEGSEPAQAALGAQCQLVYASSNDRDEPLRLAICRQWNVDLAIRDLKQWQRSLKARGTCREGAR
jgi:hypothetical protein